jgi:hypothetical protein
MIERCLTTKLFRTILIKGDHKSGSWQTPPYSPKKVEWAYSTCRFGPYLTWFMRYFFGVMPNFLRKAAIK